MQVKNKIIEQLDDGAKEFFYRLLDDNILICMAKAEIPNKKNIEKCGDGYLVYAPNDEQLPFCYGRVVPFYDFFPDMKDDAEYWSHRTQEEFIRAHKVIEPQYDIKETYDFLMRELKEGTLWNVIDYNTLKEFTDDGNDIKIEIGEIYLKGKWSNYVCFVSGIKEIYNLGVSYNEQDLKAAMKHFKKYMKGVNRAAFNKFTASEAEM